MRRHTLRMDCTAICSPSSSISPAKRSLEWLVRQGDGYVEPEHSVLLGPESTGVTARIDGPPTG